MIRNRRHPGRAEPPSPRRRFSLVSHIVTANCNDCKYTDCCVVCPVECFYQDETMLYIDPEDCIDCEACVPECPVEAIFPEAGVPSVWTQFVQLNPEPVAVLKDKAGHITQRQEPKVGPSRRERQSVCA